MGGTLWPRGEPSAQQRVIFCLQSVLPSDPASLLPRVRQTWFMLAQQRTRVSKNPTADFLHIQSQTCLCAIKSYRLQAKRPCLERLWEVPVTLQTEAGRRGWSRAAHAHTGSPESTCRNAASGRGGWQLPSFSQCLTFCSLPFCNSTRNFASSFALGATRCQ